MKLTLTKLQLAVAIAAYIDQQNLNLKTKPEDVTFTNVEGELGATLDVETVSRGRPRKEKKPAADDLMTTPEVAAAEAA
jgi:hypothetical protein